MFYRRKVILTLLDLFGGELEKIRLQKLLFLFCQSQEKAAYDFIPYKYGCYSYSANADLTTMVSKGLLSESEKNFQKIDTRNYSALLHSDDLLKLKTVQALYGGMSSDSLMQHTYRNFPYWAINSIKAESLLTAEEFATVRRHCTSNDDKTILFTIGYEGGSLEKYLNKLIRNDIKILIDVRNNPISMKYGFSKTLLKRYCESLGIQYMHFPEVGIISEKRQALTTQADYEKLFAEYRRTNLSQTKVTQQKILDILKSHKRIALTCFEADHCQCHRSHLAQSISNLPDFDYDIVHL